MINEHVPMFYQKAADYTRAARVLAKVAMIVGLVDAVARAIIGLDGVAFSILIAGFGFGASRVLEGAANQLRGYSIVAHHRIMGQESK